MCYSLVSDEGPVGFKSNCVQEPTDGKNVQFLITSAYA